MVEKLKEIYKQPMVQAAVAQWKMATVALMLAIMGALGVVCN